jgi:NADPH-dependent 2,4-dienoyl-CoA reductase/sulfur reductase-like enzyme
MKPEGLYRYVVVGGGLAGASAIEGIREIDSSGAILLVAAEAHLPYDRPPLTKKLWFGKMKEQQIYLHDRAWFEQAGVDLLLGRRVVAVEEPARSIVTDSGERFRYERLLLATGGTPRRLPIPGADLDGVIYYRSVDDFERTRDAAAAGASVTVIGAGFIGSEIAAALAINRVRVTLVNTRRTLVPRIFPEELGRWLEGEYARHGVVILDDDAVVAIERADGRLLTRTRAGQRLPSDLVIAGVGIDPSTRLAQTAGIAVGNGILVDEFLETSRDAIYAAGDNAFFPYAALGRSVRIEHWDNARSQGRQAGRNMAGAREAFTYMPYFFSDLFEFGYEAVGDVRSSLETVADWQETNRRGVLYYLEREQVRGVMLCNVWEKLEVARELIRRGGKVAPAELHDAIT